MKANIAQSRVSDLLCGKWDKFSLEMLITLEGEAWAESACRVCSVRDKT